MTRVIAACLIAIVLAACGIDGEPEPVATDSPPAERSIGVTGAIIVEEVL